MFCMIPGVQASHMMRPTEVGFFDATVQLTPSPVPVPLFCGPEGRAEGWEVSGWHQGTYTDTSDTMVEPIVEVVVVGLVVDARVVVLREHICLEVGPEMSSEAWEVFS